MESVPSQEQVGPRWTEPQEAPEHRLMLAILQDALATFQRGINTSMRNDIEAFREVDRWFRSRDYDSLFSFENICCSLQIDPGCVREGLNRLRRRAFTDRTASRSRTVLRERIYTRRVVND